MPHTYDPSLCFPVGSTCWPIFITYQTTLQLTGSMYGSGNIQYAFGVEGDITAQLAYVNNVQSITGTAVANKIVDSLTISTGCLANIVADLSTTITIAIPAVSVTMQVTALRVRSTITLGDSCPMSQVSATTLLDLLQSDFSGNYYQNPTSAYALPQELGAAGQTLCGGRLDCSSILGSGKGDPHFSSFSGGNFDIHGVKNTVYNIFSSYRVQINAHFIGTTNSTLTYLGGTAILTHAFKMHYSPETDNFTVNGIPLPDFTRQQLASCEGDESWAFKYPGLVVLQLPGLRLSLSRKWQAKDSLYACKYVFRLLRDQACYVTPHGVLGQTASFIAPVHPLDGNGLGVIEGALEEYIEPSLFSTASVYSRFGRKNDSLSSSF